MGAVDGVVMNWKDYIEVRPEVMIGKPVFAGTQLTVEHVLRERASGTTEAELLEAHPQLTAAHIMAAMLFAAELIGLETTVAL